ncbi:solute-binding periplasmic protein [Escherichia coli]|uniref:Solute-binding periplasmic protein n=1 Tax=Escherichia coli TaxID=562 RepID=A0A376P3J4_ECOLX|nr:solute-binding periplasmic protein [Escherichia coli]
MRVLLFLLLSLFMLPAFSADNLLRWHDAQHFMVQASMPLKAKTRMETVRALSQPERFILVIVELWYAGGSSPLWCGFKSAGGRRLQPVGYPASTKSTQCKQWGAEAILLGSSTTSFPDLQKQVASLPVIELVNAIDAPQVKSRVGVPWFQMGYQPGRYLVQWAHGKPLNVLLMPGPDNAGGSKEMVEGFRAAIAGSPVRIVDIALGDNDIEIQRNLLQEMLERHPEIDVVAGTAIAAEAAMGEGRNLKTPLTVVSFYLSHQVYRGLKRGRVIMAASDQMVWQGELAVEQAIRQLQGQSVSDNVSPPILVLTPKKCRP